MKEGAPSGDAIQGPLPPLAPLTPLGGCSLIVAETCAALDKLGAVAAGAAALVCGGAALVTSVPAMRPTLVLTSLAIATGACVLWHAGRRLAAAAAGEIPLREIPRALGWGAGGALVLVGPPSAGVIPAIGGGGVTAWLLALAGPAALLVANGLAWGAYAGAFLALDARDRE